MANVKLIFSGTESSETSNNELKLFVTESKELFIEIADPYAASLCLDKETAVRLVRELKRQISLM